MTDAPQKAFDLASQLPDDAQDELAAAILEELEAEAAFDRRLAETAPERKRLAEQALKEHRAGRTRPLDPEAL
ncbi:MAG: hypothetical protein WD646_09015 [Actinomycetota bacterium]